jgi:recombinational DNA repair protein RecR
VQAALLVSKCEPKSISKVAEEMKVHGLLVCTYLFAQGDVDSCKDHNREKEKVCVCEIERERKSISKQ